ncbi:hypothetical protein CISIN_1g045991mg [Citrus sinensis]|uniref:Uncharacterized protein n=1 Tax=Citrus sinensis TaxID=2711 RepID=A0A067DJT3_CITSI|nr:hypothetical protein CISIN_1g045991mg [Citrus sinensis]
MSVACPTIEHTPHSLICCPRANCCTKEVRFETCCSREVVLTSLTHLSGGSRSFLVLNCWELVAILAMRFWAASGVLSKSAPPLAASIILLSIGSRPS